MKINPKTSQHGSAAGLELLLEIERINVATRLIERAACAARFRGKMHEG